VNNLPATRNESATTDSVIQLVSFELGGEEYGVDVLSVREIIRMPTITKMPNTEDYVDGIVNLRGTVVPIISLRKRFGLCETEQDHNSRILVMEVGDGMTGFVVDGVSEVIRIHGSEIQPPPSLIISGGISNDFITGVYNHGDRMLIIIDLSRMFTDEEQNYLSSIQ